jgi:3-oxoacyl-(acyl-carrier-protein) synthase
LSIVQTLPNLAAGWVSIELGARGPLLTQSTACAASNMVIGDARDDSPRARRGDGLRRHRGRQ